MESDNERKDVEISFSKFDSKYIERGSIDGFETTTYQTSYV